MRWFITRCSEVCQNVFAMSAARFYQREKSISFNLSNAFMRKSESEIVHMSSNKKKHYLIVARDDFFEWAEARALFKAKTWWIIEFLWENVICRHDCFEKLTMNDDSEYKKIFKKLVKRYRIKKMITSDYHFQINEMIKRDYKFLSDALFKMSDEELKSWINNMHVVF